MPCSLKQQCIDTDLQQGSQLPCKEFLHSEDRGELPRGLAPIHDLRGERQCPRSIPSRRRPCAFCRNPTIIITKHGHYRRDHHHHHRGLPDCFPPQEILYRTLRSQSSAGPYAVRILMLSHLAGFPLPCSCRVERWVQWNTYESSC